MAQQYRRYKVSCPLGKGEGCLHPSCAKKRGAGPGQTKSFGEKEPIAFLGAWAKRAPEFTGQEPRGRRHVDYNPKVDEVRAYMIERGWIES